MSAEAKPAKQRATTQVDRLKARLKTVERERDALRIDSQRLAWLCKPNGWDDRDLAEIDASRSKP